MGLWGFFDQEECAMTDVATGTTPELGDVGTENGTKPCFYDSDALEYLTPLDLSQGLPEAEREEFLSQYGEGARSARSCTRPRSR